MTAAGVFAVFSSATAVLVLMGTGVSLLVRGNRVRAGVAMTAWGVAFVVAYFGVYRAAAAGAYMQTYWAADFLTPATYLPGGRAWGVLSHSFVEALVLRPVPGLVAWGATAAFVAGLWRLVRARGWSVVALLVGPIGATMVASLVRGYPFNWRLLLFTVPLVVLLLAASLDWVAEGKGPVVRRGMTTAAVAVTAGATGRRYLTPLSHRAGAPTRSVLGARASPWGARLRLQRRHSRLGMVRYQLARARLAGTRLTRRLGGWRPG